MLGTEEAPVGQAATIAVLSIANHQMVALARPMQLLENLHCIDVPATRIL